MKIYILHNLPSYWLLSFSYESVREWPLLDTLLHCHRRCIWVVIPADYLINKSIDLHLTLYICKAIKMVPLELHLNIFHIVHWTVIIKNQLISLFIRKTFKAWLCCSNKVISLLLHTGDKPRPVRLSSGRTNSLETLSSTYMNGQWPKDGAAVFTPTTCSKGTQVGIMSSGSACHMYASLWYLVLFLPHVTDISHAY